MDFNSTIDLIIKDLNEARDIIDDLKRYPGVPAIQVELAKSKCKSAGEVIALLKNMKNNFAAPEVKVHKKEESKSIEVILDDLSEVQQTKESQPQTSIEQTFTPVPEKKTEHIQPGKKSAESTIIADQFSHLSTSYNEQLGSMKHEDDLSEILKTKPVTNLSEAIGVNDRFLFIREIFNGNQELYDQAIIKLDSVMSMEDASAVIKSYTGDDGEYEVIKQLLDIVKRKLP